MLRLVFQPPRPVLPTGADRLPGIWSALKENRLEKPRAGEEMRESSSLLTICSPHHRLVLQQDRPGLDAPKFWFPPFSQVSRRLVRRKLGNTL